MRRVWTACLLVATTSACSSSDPVDEGADPQAAPQPIVNGSLDTTHQAAVAIFSGGSKCSGTIVAVVGNQGYALTAAHCVSSAPDWVMQGDDYSNDPQTIEYPAVDFLIHPNYDMAFYDFAMIRFTGAGASTPVIAPMTAAEDNIVDGSQLDLIGYGQTQSGQTSQRHHVVRSIYNETNLLLTFDQMAGGICFGDSGGPAIAVVGGSERVAGVAMSVTDSDCTEYGISGRVSAITDSFILPFINGGPTGMQTCDQCYEATTNGVGPCVATVDACFDDADCAALIECFNGCSTQACSQQCFEDHLVGAQVYKQIGKCVCMQGCPAECATESFCNPPPCGFTASASCQGCFEASCCAESTVCSNDPACTGCVVKTPTPSCDQNALYTAFTDCLVGSCADECNLDPGTGGGGAGGGGVGGSSSTGGAPAVGGAGPAPASAGPGPTSTASGGDTDGGDDDGTKSGGDPGSEGGCSAFGRPPAGSTVAAMALAWLAAAASVRRRRARRRSC